MWSVFKAALFPVPRAIQVYSYFLSNNSSWEKCGYLYAPSPVPFHTEPPFGTGHRGSPLLSVGRQQGAGLQRVLQACRKATPQSA